VPVPDHPVLLEIVGAASSDITAPPAAPVATPPSPTDLALTLPSPQTVTAGTTHAIAGVSISDAWATSATGAMTVNVWDDDGDGTIAVPGHAASGSLTISGTLAQINAGLAGLSFIAGSTSGSDGITVDAWNQAGVEKTQTISITISPASTISPADPIITAPASESATTGSTIAITGVSVNDVFAATNPGTMVLNLNAGSGTFGLIDPVGAAITGVGTDAVTVDGTLAQINADLVNLSYRASASSGSIGVNVWDQAGLDSTATIGVTVSAAAAPVDLISIAAGTATSVISASNATIDATADNHSIRINGSGDVIDAGAGANQIDDTGSGNIIVLPQADQGSDAIQGDVLQHHDSFDLRSLLAATKWTGSLVTIGNFLHVSAPDGTDAVISVTPSGVGGASYNVATLHDSGSVSLTTLLAHSLV
jgi:hypothetical protein